MVNTNLTQYCKFGFVATVVDTKLTQYCKFWFVVTVATKFEMVTWVDIRRVVMSDCGRCGDKSKRLVVGVRKIRGDCGQYKIYTLMQLLGCLW